MAVALREDCSLDFYADFCYFGSTTKGEEYSEVHFDFKNFYFRKKIKADKSSNDSNKAKTSYFALSKCKLSWKSIGERFMKAYKKDPEKSWSQRFLNRRVANHLKIFTDMQLLSTYMLVAHRNIVSIYCTIKEEWIQNLKFTDYVSSLSSTELLTSIHSEAEKDLNTAKNKRVAVLVGSSRFEFIEESEENSSSRKANKPM